MKTAWSTIQLDIETWRIQSQNVVNVHSSCCLQPLRDRPRGGVSPPTHRETRCRPHGVSRRCWRLPDCPRTPRIERSTQLYRPESHRKMVLAVTMRIDHFRPFWLGSQPSEKRWLRRFRHYYNRHRPNQALNGCTPAEEVLNRTVPLAMFHHATSRIKYLYII